MSRKTELTTAAATLACALGIGFVMQSGDVADARYDAEVPLPAGSTPTVGNAQEPAEAEPALLFESDAALTISDIILTSADIEKVTLAPLPEKPVLRVVDEAIDLTEILTQVQTSCPLMAVATPDAAAMVRLNVTAPCHAGERVTITHSGISFVETTSLTGSLDILVPTLAEEATFSVAFETGESLDAAAVVPSVALYDRIILQWSGAPGVEIHAREFGADYGSEGHVWIGAPRDITAVASGTGGFIMRHGDPSAEPPMIVEVYTFPAATTRAEGAVILTVEAEVTEANCDTDISAQAFEVARGGEVFDQDLVLSIPGCDAIGNFLVLNSLFKDLTVASN